MHHFFQYLKTVFLSWVVLMSGIVAVIFEALSRAKYEVGHRWWWGVAGLAVFIASYQAWLPQEVKNEACLAGYVENVIAADQSANIDSPQPRAVVIVEMSVGNACDEPTIAQEYQLIVTSPSANYRPVDSVLNLRKLL